jgi:hypothetical protein
MEAWIENREDKKSDERVKVEEMISGSQKKFSSRDAPLLRLMSVFGLSGHTARKLCYGYMVFIYLFGVTGGLVSLILTVPDVWAYDTVLDISILTVIGHYILSGSIFIYNWVKSSRFQAYYRYLDEVTDLMVKRRIPISFQQSATQKLIVALVVSGALFIVAILTLDFFLTREIPVLQPYVLERYSPSVVTLIHVLFYSSYSVIVLELCLVITEQNSVWL